MFRENVRVVVLILTCLSLLSCGGGKSAPLGDVGAPPAADLHSQPAGALPSLGELPPVERELSLVGPGWFDIPFANEFYQLALKGCTVLPGGIEIDGTGGTGYAIYGVGGFDGDNGPTSARVTAGDITGEYWVGFSDYEHGNWVYSGPFTGSAEAEIPNTGDYPSPGAFVSPAGTCYVAVLVPEDSFLGAEQLELGVHGGMHGPQPPYDLGNGGGETALELIWRPSLSEGDPDFAGYHLERAPQFYGDFAPLTSEPITDTSYVDETVVPDEVYRYRVAAEDVSGNLSAYVIQVWLTATAGNKSDPVAILDLPPGPIYGPAQVKLDLDRSYDPAGGTIDTYEVETIGMAPLSGPAHSYTVDLQPGCYVFRANVHVGPRNGSTFRTFKVYPQWKENPSVAFITGGTLPRLAHARAGTLPDGSLVVYGYDASIPAVAVWHQVGGDFQLTPLPLNITGEPEFIGEPILVGDSLNFLSLGGNKAITYSFNGAEGYVSGMLSASGNLAPYLSLVKLPGDKLAVIFAEENGGITDLKYQQLGNFASTAIVEANISAPLTGVDAVYNAESDAIDIMFGDSISTNWRRFQPGTGNLKSAGIANFKPLWLDLEVDPSTGRAVMAHYFDTVPQRVRYQLLNEDNETWTIFTPIDDSDDSVWPGDLLGTADGLYYIGGLNNGGNPVYKLYKYDSGNWTVRNTAQTQFMGHLDLGLAWNPDSGNLWAAGELPSRDAQVEGMIPGGTTSIDWTLTTDRGQGREMHGAVGADGLHVIYKDAESGLTYHLSSLTGAPWVYEGNPFGTASDLDLGSTSTGEVYASFVTPGNSAELHYWDGNAWVVQQAYPSLKDYRPSLSDQPLQDKIHWAVYIPATTHIRYVNGSQSVPFSFTAVTPTVSPVWDGTVQNAGFSLSGSEALFAMAGGSIQPAGKIGRFIFPEDNFELKLGQASVDQSPEAWGRMMDSSIYATVTDYVRVYWVVHGSAFNSVIYEASRPGERHIEIPLDPYEIALTQDDRRTVTMGYTKGGGAVGLECDLFGESPVFKWCNFGNWEDLPLPPGLAPGEGGHLSMPELLIGDDGRWHIIYHDFYTDFIMVRSTL